MGATIWTDLDRYKFQDGLTEQKENIIFAHVSQTREATIPKPDRLEGATDQAIAACGGDARDAVKALIVANEFLVEQVAELQAAVSAGYCYRSPRTVRLRGDLVS